MNPQENSVETIADTIEPRLTTLADRGISRPVFNLEFQKSEHFDITDDRFWAIASQVFDYSELSVAALFQLYSSVNYILDREIPGDLVECGVHMGGAIMLVANVLKQRASQRKLFALDTFGGFVRRSEELDVDIRSGSAACLVEDSPLDYFKPSSDNMRSVGYDGLHIVKGDVLETIPTLEVDQIALLRLDTDTYDTTKFELEQMYDRVPPGGIIIVDDYGYTFGCRKAVDDFIADKDVLLQRISPYVRSWVKIS